MVVATCPNCGARYQLTARQIGPNGRTLKCAKCAHQWFMAPVVPSVAAGAGAPAQQAENQTQPPADTSKEPSPEGQEAATVPLAPAPPEREEEDNQLASLASLGNKPQWLRRATASPLALTLVAMAFILGALGLGVWSLLSPSSGGQSGLHPTPLPQDTVTPPNLALSDIQRNLSRRGETWVLTISGRLTNTGKEAMPLPELRVQLLDKQGIELDYWPAELTTTNLAGGAETTWQARFLNPPLARIGSYRAFFRNVPATLAEAGGQGAITAPAPTLDDTPTHP